MPEPGKARACGVRPPGRETGGRLRSRMSASAVNLRRACRD